MFFARTFNVNIYITKGQAFRIDNRDTFVITNTELEKFSYHKDGSYNIIADE